MSKIVSFIIHVRQGSSIHMWLWMSLSNVICRFDSNLTIGTAMMGHEQMNRRNNLWIIETSRKSLSKHLLWINATGWFLSLEDESEGYRICLASLELKTDVEFLFLSSWLLVVWRMWILGSVQVYQTQFTCINKLFLDKLVTISSPKGSIILL
jgi:hypothetical protein